MKRKRYSEEQIIGILREHEAGLSTDELVRRHGIAHSTFHRWKAKFGGMGVSEAKRLRELEAENARLKRLLAEAEHAVSISMGSRASRMRERRSIPGKRITTISDRFDHSLRSHPQCPPMKLFDMLNFPHSTGLERRDTNTG